MPEPSTFDIQTPSGHVLSIEAPDQETALAGARQWHEENTSLLGQAIDFAKSTPTGIATVGIPGILGGPGDVRKGLSSATDIISGNLGIDPAKTEQFKNTFYNASKLNPVLAPFTQPGSQEIKSVLEQNVINHILKDV